VRTQNSKNWNGVVHNAIATRPKKSTPPFVKEAKDKHDRAKLEYVHRRINGEIRYEPDPAQWGLPDHWSLPVDVEGKGSLNTGVGDCEDYVLAKYLVLLDARFPDKYLRILLVRDNFVRADHAVLAAHNDNKWLSSTIVGTVYMRIRTLSTLSRLWLSMHKAFIICRKCFVLPMHMTHSGLLRPHVARWVVSKEISVRSA
jgi:predicted transglutaminase-like cysteine proteinase